jgi:hypothetical protein
MTTNNSFKSPERIRTETLQERTFLFAKEILDLCPRRYDSDPSRVIKRCQLQHHARLGKLPDEARQLCAIFATIVRNTECRLEAERVAKEAEKRRRTTDN